MNIDKLMQGVTLALIVIMVVVSCYAFMTGRINFGIFMSIWDGPIGMAFGYWIGRSK